MGRRPCRRLKRYDENHDHHRVDFETIKARVDPWSRQSVMDMLKVLVAKKEIVVHDPCDLTTASVHFQH